MAQVRDSCGSCGETGPPLQTSVERDFDLIVLGGGSAGFASAIRGAELGARVAIVQEGTLGGTCVNVGCIPSKALIRAAGANYLVRRHPFDGIPHATGGIEWPAVRAQKNRLVSRLRQEKYADVLDAYAEIQLFRGRGRLESDGSVRLPDGTVLRGGACVIATGSSPLLPAIPGLAEARPLNSTTALELEQLPGSLVVLGAGSVGLELGQALARLGVRVTLLARSRLLSKADPEIGAALAELLRDEGVEVVEGVRVDRVELDPGGTQRIVHATGPGGEARSWKADHLLVAAGRSPNTSGFGLQEAGVEIGPRGEIRVDEYLQTTHPKVFAAGDVIGEPMHVYVAAHAGGVAAENALSGAERRLDLSLLPQVVFTDPSVAWVGLGEEAARGAGREPRVSVLPMEHVPRALTSHDSRGFVKLVADADTRRILGAAILAPEAVEMIMEPTLAIRARLTIDDLIDTLHPYLTYGEAIRLAAQAFDREVARLSCCAA